MIAPGVIKPNKTSAAGKFVTASFTTAGFELLISGQSSQKVAVHTSADAHAVFASLKDSKKLQGFIFKERVRKPGV